MNILRVNQQKDVQIDQPFLIEQSFDQKDNQYRTKYNNPNKNQQSNINQPKTTPLINLPQVKQKLTTFHNQIRTNQRQLIKKQLRISKYQQDKQASYWQQHLETAIEQELEEQRHWKQLADESYKEEEEFWKSFSGEGVEYKGKEQLQQLSQDTDVII